MDSLWQQFHIDIANNDYPTAVRAKQTIYPKLLPKISDGFPQSKYPKLPLYEHTFYPVSTVPTITPTRERKDL